MLAHDHPLAENDELSLEDLEQEPMILLDIPLSRDYFLSMFHSTGMRPEIAERTTDMAVARSLVANGFGFGLINIRPKTPLAPDGEKLVFLPFSGDHRPMVLGLATKRSDHRSRIVSAFHEHVQDRVRQSGLPGLA